MNPSLHKRSNSGFTIVEVIVSTVIFAIAAVGVFASIAAVHAPAIVSERKVAAAYYARQVADNLRAKVDARNWNPVTSSWIAGTALETGTHSLGTTTMNNTAYTTSYVISPVAGTNLWKMDVTVNWTP